MSYSPPSLGTAGLTIPVYADIQNNLIGQYQTIYGLNTYTALDAADYQWISAVSAQAADCMLCCQLAVNARSPLTAIGADLDSICKLNGLVRKSASASTAPLTITGSVNAVITNGLVQDANGLFWALSASVTIPTGLTVNVLASCTTLGPINATAGQISVISTPSSGWFTATNLLAATPGLPIETDAQLRARQALSVTLPSITMFTGTVAGIAAVPGVTRYNVFENYFGYTASYGFCSTSGTAVTITSGYPLDSTCVSQQIVIAGTSYTISAVGSATTCTVSATAGTQTGVAFYIGNGVELGPRNSITAIVENGTSAAVAQAIYANRGIGCNPNGTTTVTVADPTSGATMPISFSRPTYVPIYVSISVHGVTSAFTTVTQLAIQTAIANYLNSLQFGELVVLSELYGAALTARGNPLVPIFSIKSLTLGLSASPTGTADLTFGWNQVALGALSTTVLTVV